MKRSVISRSNLNCKRVILLGQNMKQAQLNLNSLQYDEIQLVDPLVDAVDLSAGRCEQVRI